MSDHDVAKIREAATLIRDVESDPATVKAWSEVADFLDFTAPFALQPNPYAPTVEHGLRIALAYLGQAADDFDRTLRCSCSTYRLGSLGDIREVEGMAHGSVSCVEQSEVGP